VNADVVVPCDRTIVYQPRRYFKRSVEGGSGITYIIVELFNRDGMDMDEKLTVAVPSMAPGGLEAGLSGHFGHCDVFTMVSIEQGKIGEVKLLGNIPHEQGGCMAPVNLLAQAGANALIAGGMGMRPLMGFSSVGIRVYHSNGNERVDRAVSDFIEGRLPEFGKDNVCGGGGAHHGGCGGG